MLAQPKIRVFCGSQGWVLDVERSARRARYAIVT